MDQAGRYSVEPIQVRGLGPAERGPLRRIRCIGGVPYVCGTDCQVYRGETNKPWQSVGPKQSALSSDVHSFESIDGFSQSSLYAVGLQGAIWHGDGALWYKIDSPVDLVLNDVCCAPDGQTYVCGRGGVFIVGREDSWEVVEHDFQDEDFWSVSWFHGEVLVASLYAIYRFNGNALELLSFGNESPCTCYRLSAADGLLWSIGAKDILAFEENKWSRID